ncbi:hypothetical protein CXB51_033612 [Gossypium anomalum]|uniref:Reverse transcriptase domain-containing protein n=1 Tax=Gossypium anomalum TaxID=47600 RepID=A0A8J5XZL0_9ROSI|nr:hypothetical protein CXB51_033612 [Gossypium anomalum]
MASINETIIVLVPKISEPSDMTNFRPISLCRVFYKIIAKTLANRLKGILPRCISLNQSAFVSGRMIHDNILIAQELIHYLHSSKKGSNKGLVVKLDMSKAYDQMEWNFLEDVISKIGFDMTWISLIMKCMRSVKYVIKCNGCLSDPIIPERGIRQGDPLSPYIFLFCMEAFSRILLCAQNHGIIRGVRASMNGPNINHLFFTNDLSSSLETKKGKLKDTLCYRVFSSKYFPDSNLFSPKQVDRPSGTWRSIAIAVRSLRKGFGWLVGNGKSVDIHNDNWGFEGLNGEAFICSGKHVREKKVHDLWMPDSKHWDRNRVNEIYGETLGDQICNIPILSRCSNDVLVWFHSHHGTYTTKAAYSWLILRKIGMGPHRLFWKMIWKLKIIPKIYIFAWTVGHEIMPTNSKIATIQPFVNPCPEKETLIHTLKDCPTARETLKCGGLDYKLVSSVFDRCIDWLEMALRILDKKKAMENFITLIWNSWNNRNNFKFRGKEEDVSIIWNKALTLSNNFRIHNLSEKLMLPRQPHDHKWIKPSVWAEIMAIEEGVRWAKSLNLKRVQIESDSTNIVNKINSRSQDITFLGQRGKAIQTNLRPFEEAVIKWAPRSSNKIANFICKFVLSKNCMWKFDMNCPKRFMIL